MEVDRYAGVEGQKRLREDEDRNSGRVRTEAQEARRDLQARVPYGRALDDEDLLSMLDEANQTNRAIVLRRRLLAQVRRQAPSAVLITSQELEQLRADSIEHPTRPGPAAGIPEWGSSS